MSESSNSPRFAKLRVMSLADALALAKLPPQVAAPIAGLPDVPEALAALRRAGLLAEAGRLTAFALPKREAVWWACMCARAVPPAEPAANDQLALEEAEAWVYRPGEATGRVAFARAQDAGFGTPEAWAAVAAFWSGESIAPPGRAIVVPAPNLAGMAVAGAIALASVRNEPGRRVERLRRFLDGALDIANGGSGRLPPEAT